MTVERQRRVRALFDAAMDQPAHLRSVFLASACDGDDALRATVEKLLRANERSAGILDTPIHERHEMPMVERAPGTFIGAYKILKELPGGGMGVVYQAIRADEVFQRVCAVKVIRAELSSQWMIERFRKERQILAQLDHVHIARIVDGGSTPDKLPYFVMDYVDGLSIDKYCRQHRFTNRQRLQLFQQACAAVHYAHQQGVIHGDLKPPNILVGNDGVVKLVDFGIATVVAQENAENEAMPLMTPAYASPEQLRSDALTATSDVYSLGVILYELLSGARPFATEGRSRSEVLNAIATVNPTPPSVVVKAVSDASAPAASGDTLKGDLDWIILKAVDREPAHRYQSAAEFSGDITRFLERRPVLASKKGFFYRATKLVSRHQRGALAAGLIAGLLAAVSWQGWELRERYQQSMQFQDQIRQLQLRQEESLQELQRSVSIDPAALKSLSSTPVVKQLRDAQVGETRKMANAYRTSFSESVRLWPGMTHTRRNLLDRADRYLRQAEPLVVDDPASPEGLATAWLWLANIEGNPQTINLHDTDGAKASIDEATRIIENAPDAPEQLRNEIKAAALQISKGHD